MLLHQLFVAICNYDLLPSSVAVEWFAGEYAYCKLVPLLSWRAFWCIDLVIYCTVHVAPCGVMLNQGHI